MALIYIVEDDKNISEIESFSLKNAGHETKEFADGKSFSRELMEKKPDLILLDVMLPDEDGISILKRMKAESLTAVIPVIMLSAKSTEIDKVTALEAGADDYITKPFGIMELLSRIKAVLRRSHSNPAELSDLLKLQDLTIDLKQRTVTYQEQELMLTYKEFELLTYLTRNRGTAISRDRLLEQVWGFQYEGETRTVDAHIKTLRQKLDAAGCHSLISTIRGYGYKIGG